MRRLLQIWRAPFLLLAPFLVLGGCGGGGGGTGGSATGWTVLVYMVADNNLEPDALKDLEEMSKVGSENGLQIVVEIDRSADYSSDPLGNIPDFTTTKRLLVQNGSYQELQDLGELDTGTQPVLADFIGWGLKNYGSGHNMLVFWDHGGALKGFGWDESTSAVNNLSPDEIVGAVQQGLQNAGKTSFDIIGFDACLMSTYEVALYLKPYASYIIASEDVEPGHGWDYDVLSIAKSSTPSAETLGKAIIDGYLAQANAEGTADDVTLALIDPSKLTAIGTALDAFHAAYPAASLTASVVTGIGTSRGGSLEFAKASNPSKSYNMVDGGDLFDRIATSVTGATTAGQVRDAITAAVVYKIGGSNRTKAHGLTIYFPPAENYYNTAYDSAVGVDSWKAFLKDYYAAGVALTPPAFDCTSSGNCTYSTAGNILTLKGKLTEGSLANVAFKAVYYGFPESSGATGGAYLLGDNPATTSTNSGDWVQGTWDYSYINITQGSSSYYGFLDNPQSTNGQTKAVIPLAYFLSASDTNPSFTQWQVTYDSSHTVTQSAYYLIDNNGGMAELTPQPGTLFKTILLYMPGKHSWSDLAWTYFTSAPTFDATQPLHLTAAAVQTGYYAYAALRVENAAGVGALLYIPDGFYRP